MVAIIYWKEQNHWWNYPFFCSMVLNNQQGIILSKQSNHGLIGLVCFCAYF